MPASVPGTRPGKPRRRDLDFRPVIAGHAGDVGASREELFEGQILSGLALGLIYAATAGTRPLSPLSARGVFNLGDRPPWGSYWLIGTRAVSSSNPLRTAVTAPAPPPS